jgi:hypothetical protein
MTQGKRIAIAADSWGAGRLDVFTLGSGNDMFHKAFDGTWRPAGMDWEALAGRFTP